MSALWLLLLLGGCAHPTKQVVTTSLETLLEEQATLGAIAGSPELQEAARKLSMAVVDGSLDALRDDDRAVLLEARTTALVDALSPVLARSIQQDLGPAVRGELQKAVYAAVLQATSTPLQGRVERVAAGVSASVADVLIPKVGPAVGASLRADILPALEDTLQRTVLEQDRNLIRAGVNEAMLGIADALDGALGAAIDTRTEKSMAIVVAELDQRTTKWENRFYVLGTVLLGVIGLAGWSIHTRRRRIRAVEDTLLMVMSSIKAHEDELAVRQTVQDIRKNGSGNERGDLLKEMLRKKPDLRVEPAPPTSPPAPEQP